MFYENEYCPTNKISVTTHHNTLFFEVKKWMGPLKDENNKLTKKAAKTEKI